jgi:hypothetical protein
VNEDAMKTRGWAKSEWKATPSVVMLLPGAVSVAFVGGKADRSVVSVVLTRYKGDDDKEHFRIDMNEDEVIKLRDKLSSALTTIEEHRSKEIE